MLLVGLAGERSSTLANKSAASLGPESWEPSASAISIRNWSSWLREKFVPEEGCSLPGEREDRWASSDTVELAGSFGGAGGGESTCRGPCSFTRSCLKILSAKRVLVPEV